MSEALSGMSTPNNGIDRSAQSEFRIVEPVPFARPDIPSVRRPNNLPAVMRCKAENMNKKIAIAYLSAGGMIAVAQSVLLAHIFINCKPYKMLEEPSSNFYWWAGWIAGIASPLIAIGLAYYANRIKEYWKTIIPTAATPVFIWLIYRTMFIVSGYKYVERSSSDFVGDETVEQAFAQQVLLRLFDGLVIAVGAIALLSMLYWIAGKVKKPAEGAA